MKTAKEKGTFGTWLAETRKSRGFSNVNSAREAVASATGTKAIAYSVWAEYESGTRMPSAAHREALVSFFGAPPDDQRGGVPTTDLASLVATLAAQAAAIDRLASAIEQQAARAEKLELAMAGAMRALAEAADRSASTTPTVPATQLSVAAGPQE